MCPEEESIIMSSFVSTLSNLNLKQGNSREEEKVRYIRVNIFSSRNIDLLSQGVGQDDFEKDLPFCGV